MSIPFFQQDIAKFEQPENLKHLNVSSIKIMRGTFQPRDLEGRTTESRQQMQKLEEMSQGLRATLELGGETRDPIKVIRVILPGDTEPTYVLCSGEHRLTDYKNAGRKTIPAYVYEGEDAWEVGRGVSVWDNCQGSMIPLGITERFNSCFIVISEKSQYGGTDMDCSIRDIELAFQGKPGHSTIHTMIKVTQQIRGNLEPEVAEGFPKLPMDLVLYWPKTWKEAQQRVKGFGDTKARTEWGEQMKKVKQYRKQLEQIKRSKVKTNGDKAAWLMALEHQRFEDTEDSKGRNRQIRP